MRDEHTQRIIPSPGIIIGRWFLYTGRHPPQFHKYEISKIEIQENFCASRTVVKAAKRLDDLQAQFVDGSSFSSEPRSSKAIS
jgi:hypothetical protein